MLTKDDDMQSKWRDCVKTLAKKLKKNKKKLGRRMNF